MLHTLTPIINFPQFTVDDEMLSVTQRNKIFSSDIGIASGWLKWMSALTLEYLLSNKLTSSRRLYHLSLSDACRPAFTLLFLLILKSHNRTPLTKHSRQIWHMQDISHAINIYTYTRYEVRADKQWQASKKEFFLKTFIYKYVRDSWQNCCMVFICRCQFKHLSNFNPGKYLLALKLINTHRCVEISLLDNILINILVNTVSYVLSECKQLRNKSDVYIY